MNEFLRHNRRVWDERAEAHPDTPFYDVAGFRAGACSLRAVEKAELGDVSGKALLHLACHFGLDTLSWARRGALVTGVDFSPKAIARARALARECGLHASFVCSAIEDLPGTLAGQFDVVFLSYGVLCWLADLRRCADVVAHFLLPGGTFYVVELHPFADTLEASAGGGLHVAHGYFHSPQPVVCPAGASYADPGRTLSADFSYQWAHSLADTLTALLGAGLGVDFLHEFPFCCYARFPGMVPSAGGYWHFPEGRPSLPLLFSLKATKLG